MSMPAVASKIACNFYPRPPGGGRHVRNQKACAGNADFYPRPPGGGRPGSRRRSRTRRSFLSTPSGWRATWHSIQQLQNSNHFYPRPPGGGRPEIDYVLNCMQRISIHALRVEGDRESIRLHGPRHRFLSTPSGWRATYSMTDFPPEA